MGGAGRFGRPWPFGRRRRGFPRKRRLRIQQFEHRGKAHFDKGLFRGIDKAKAGCLHQKTLVVDFDRGIALAQDHQIALGTAQGFGEDGEFFAGCADKIAAHW